MPYAKPPSIWPLDMGHFDRAIDLRRLAMSSWVFRGVGLEECEVRQSQTAATLREHLHGSCFSGDCQFYRNIPAGGVLIGADDVGLIDELADSGLVHAGHIDREFHFDAESLLIVVRAEAHLAGDRGVRRNVDLRFSGDKLQRPEKTRGITGGKSCSGFVPGPPIPPISVGVESTTSSTPSAVFAVPSRPPVAVAWVV